MWLIIRKLEVPVISDWLEVFTACWSVGEYVRAETDRFYRLAFNRPTKINYYIIHRSLSEVGSVGRENVFSLLAIANHSVHVCIKGTYRDHRVTGALNFHKIRDFFILVMVLDI